MRAVCCIYLFYFIFFKFYFIWEAPNCAKWRQWQPAYPMKPPSKI